MINFWMEVIALLWFFLPAVFANIAPVVVAKLPVLKNWSYPLDGFAAYKGQRILGDHKTIRGVVAGVIVGGITALIQFSIVNHFSWGFQNLLPGGYMHTNPILFGFLLGFGALAGDSVKSLFKRMRNIASGKTWFPFDQLDSVIGAAVVSAVYIPLVWQQYVIVIFGGLALHIVINALGYVLGLRKELM